MSLRCCLVLATTILWSSTALTATTVPLTDLDLSKMILGWGEAGTNQSVDGNPLRIAGTTYVQGVGTHADSSLTVKVNGATRFRASVGVDDEVQGQAASVAFQVIGDEKPLWESGVMRAGDAARPVDVDLSGITTLKLLVSGTADGIGYDHANWVDAVFAVDGKAPEATGIARLSALPEIPAQVPARTIELYNGTNLDNWIADLPKGGTKDQVWAVRDGIVYCSGRPDGHLLSDTSWKDYRLVVEWRWPADGDGGNNGVLVHTSDLHVLGNHFPRSIEVQLMSGNAGDFWVIGEDIQVPDMAARREGRHIWNLTDGAEKPFGEWNQMVVHAEGDTLTVWVNDVLVNQGHDSTASEGRITLQSEGAPCQYRRVSIMPLPAP